MSKQEISLILLDEYIRLKMKTLDNKIKEQVSSLFNSSSLNPEKIVNKYLQILDKYVIEEGFTFQEQFN